jgi:hypothetical protein
MVYTLCSVKGLTEKIYRDYDIREMSKVGTILENVYEGLEMLKTYAVTVPKIETLEVKDYRTCIPKDALEIMNVYLDGRLLIKSAYAVRHPEPDEYNIIPDWILFGKETGTAEIRYQTYEVDEEGFPKIPCEPYVWDYLSKYVFYKLCTVKLHQGTIKLDFYDYVRKDMEFSKLRAKSHVLAPSLDDMEALIKMNKQLIPFTTDRALMFVKNNRHQLHRQNL